MSAALLLAVMTTASVHRYALVVGSNVGEGVRNAPLRYADDDAVAMHELLLEAGVESVLLASPDVDTARLHPATKPLAPPTLDALRGAFAAQRASMLRAREAGEEVEWLFFFSGHGDVERGEGFLGLERGRLTRAVLHDDFLARVPAERSHVVLDACRAGAVIGSKGPGGLRLPMPAAFAADPSWPASTGFLLSASSSKESHEWEKLQSGIFSYEVRSALRGAADADLDGAVSYAELGAFLDTANRAIPNPRFRPEFVALPPRGRAGLSATLLSWVTHPGVEVSVGEHAYVERENGERLLDVHSGPHPAQLHLPAERPLFVRSDDEQREATLDAPRNTVTALAVSTTRSTKGALDRALGRLFDVPFGAAEVEAWTQAWKPADLSTLVVAGPPQAAFVGRHVAGGGLLAGVVAGGLGFGVAWGNQGDAGQLDQRARLERNATIEAFNVVGVVGLSVAAASALTWVLLTWGFELPISVGPTPSASGGVLTLDLSALLR